MFRRLSFRSALTATLATRMLPVLAADSQRLAEAQRTRPTGGPTGARGRVALLSAVVGGSLDRAMDVAATLEVRGFAAARGAARGTGRARRAPSRHDIAFAASAAAILALAIAARLTGVASFDSYPRLVDAGSAPARSRSRPRCSPPRCCRSAIAGGSTRERRRCCPSSASPTAIRASSSRRSATSRCSIEPGEFCLLAGLSGSGKSTLLRAACGLVPHFHGGRFAGRVRLAGLDTREHGPARLGAFAGALFQDPETQLVTSSVRAELALALESRGQSATAVARGVEEVALALGIDALLRPLHARALRRREAARGARRRARGPAADRAARRADLAAGPGRRRRADRPAAPAQPGVGDDRRCSPSTASSAA